MPLQQFDRMALLWCRNARYTQMQIGRGGHRNHADEGKGTGTAVVADQMGRQAGLAHQAANLSQVVDISDFNFPFHSKHLQSMYYNNLIIAPSIQKKRVQGNFWPDAQKKGRELLYGYL